MFEIDETSKISFFIIIKEKQLMNVVIIIIFSFV